MGLGLENSVASDVEWSGGNPVHKYSDTSYFKSA